MHNVWTFAGILAGVFLFLHVMTLLVITARVIKLRFRSPQVLPVARSEAASLLPLLDAARPMLEQEGFQYQASCRMGAMVAAADTVDSFFDVYYHRLHQVSAEVHPASLPTERWPFDISLRTVFADGSEVCTFNGLAHLLMPHPRATTIVDNYAPNLHLQLTAHLDHCAGLTGEPLGPQAALAWMQRSMSLLMPHLCDEGKAYPSGEMNGEIVYRLRLRAAFLMAWRTRFGARRRKAVEAAGADPDLRPPPLAPELVQLAARLAFVRAASLLNGLSAPRWFRWSSFGVSAAAFLALGAWWWGWQTAWLILLVIALHEGGHWLAMKLAGFRDVHVFFVPGMGAATSGVKHDAHPLVHLAVYLAGPVPGLLLAAGLLAALAFGDIAVPAAWPLRLAGVALLVNLFNLLPVMPFDGGRVVDLFVLGRLPWGRFVFSIASGLAFAAGAWVTDNTALWIFSALVLVGARHQYRVATLSRDLLRRPETQDMASEPLSVRAGRLFDFLAQPAYRSWTAPVKAAAAMAVLPRFLGRLPGIGATVLGLSIYAASVIAPIVLVGVSVVKAPHLYAAMTSDDHAMPSQDSLPPEAGVYGRAGRAATLAAAAPMQRHPALMNAIDDAIEFEDADDALRLSHMLYAETAALAPGDSVRIAAALRLGMAQKGKDEASVRAARLALFAEAESGARARRSLHADADSALLLANVLQVREEYDSASLVLAREIASLFASYPLEADSRLPQARLVLARQLDLNGQASEAERELTQAALDCRGLSSASFWCHAVRSAHGWFLYSHRRFDEALTRAGPLTDRAAGGDRDRQHDRELLIAAVARERGDWQTVKASLDGIKPPPRQPTGNWLTRWFLPPAVVLPSDLKAALMLIDAERALGQVDSANARVAALRANYDGGQYRRADCQIGHDYDAWRASFSAIVLATEQRELHCTSGAP